MNSLKNILNSISENEKRAFLTYLKKKNRRGDTKNITLFKLIDSGKEKNIHSILYPNKDRQAYHALRKRLYNSLIDFIAEKSFENESSEEMEALKLLLASKFFFKQQQYKVAFKTIAKAEKKAIELELYNILNEIYQTQIQYAHLDTSNKISAIITKFKKNSDLLVHQQQLNLAYALLRDELNKVNHNRKIIDFQELINHTIKQLNISFEKAMNLKSLYQIMYITNEYAALNKDYYSVGNFMIKSYEYISHKDEPTNKYLYYHIYILYFMTNMHFRNKNFNEANNYIQKMHTQMHEQKGRFYNRFILKYTLLQGLIENYTGNNEIATERVEAIINKKHTYELSEILDLHLSLATYYFQKENYKKCLSTFKKLIHTDKWYEKKMGIEWAIKKILIEILLHIELQNIDYAQHRLTNFKRQYLSYLKKMDDKNPLIFINFISIYINYPEKINTSEFKEEIKISFNWKIPKQEDIFRLSFYGWLKAKTEKSNLYETTINLVNKV